MNVYLIERDPTDWSYDEAHGFVVIVELNDPVLPDHRRILVIVAR